MKYKQETTVDDIYKIAYVATNGNEKIAANIREIYREYGNNVYIDVNISNTTEDLVKTYDGMTIESGYSDSCYINQGDGTCRINNARVYVFEDPIDTPEQATFLDIIVNNNIYSAENKEHLIPTVIMAPKVSKDMAAYLGQLCQYMASADIHKRPPFLLITNIYDADQFMDIATLCGAKTIKKYSDFKLQEMNIQKGLAPTPETIIDFCGLCETVEASNSKTKFIKPKLMFDENGEHTKLFKGMIEYLEAELSTAYDQGKDAKFVFSLKKRLNSLKSNMVEYLVGGVSASDRDSERDLVEDAVLNCRSAAKDGFGYGANFEGLRASNIIEWHTINEKNINDIIARAYLTLTSLLYQTSGIGEVKANNLTMESLNTQKSPYNLRTGKFDKEVLSSINSDIVILETISKIVTLMFTCNQFLCPTPAHNTYVNPE
jgi:chaperonin GroEL (HSP60 family)